MVGVAMAGVVTVGAAMVMSKRWIRLTRHRSLAYTPNWRMISVERRVPLTVSASEYSDVKGCYAVAE